MGGCLPPNSHFRSRDNDAWNEFKTHQNNAKNFLVQQFCQNRFVRQIEQCVFYNTKQKNYLGIILGSHAKSPKNSFQQGFFPFNLAQYFFQHFQYKYCVVFHDQSVETDLGLL